MATARELHGAPSSAAPMDERRHLPLLLAALAFANLTAYGRDATIAGVFGANAHTDAYFIGAFLPTLLTTILVLESTAPALLPTFSRLASDGEATRRLLWIAAGIGSVLLCGVVVAIWLDSVPVVRLLAHGWRPDEVQAAASLLRISVGSAVPLGAGAIIAALLNAHHRYLTPPLGLVLMNVTTIGATILLGGRLAIYAPAWGTLAGSLVYLLLQLWAVARLDLPLAGRPGDVPLGIVGRAMLPTLIFSLLAQNVVIVERWLASTLPAGRISYLAYASKLMMSPLLVITAAGGLLAFVAMSHADASGDRQEFRASLARSARALTLLLTMATLVLVILGRQVVELALQHGHFSPHDTGITAMLLSIYALGLLPNGLSWLLYRSLQSRSRYWEAVHIGLAAAAVYVTCAVLLFDGWGLPGIAAAFPISQTASCILLYVRQPSYLRMPLQAGLGFAARVASLAAATGALLVVLRIVIADFPLHTFADAALTLLGGAVVVGAVLLFGTQLVRLSEGALIRAWLVGRS